MTHDQAANLTVDVIIPMIVWVVLALVIINWYQSKNEPEVVEQPATTQLEDLAWDD